MIFFPANFIMLKKGMEMLDVVNIGENTPCHPLHRLFHWGGGGMTLVLVTPGGWCLNHVVSVDRGVTTAIKNPL